MVSKAPRPLTEDEKRVRNAREDMPPLEGMINLQDFEELAEKVLSKTAWAYYRSAGMLLSILWGEVGKADLDCVLSSG